MYQFKINILDKFDKNKSNKKVKAFLHSEIQYSNKSKCKENSSSSPPSISLFKNFVLRRFFRMTAMFIIHKNHRDFHSLFKYAKVTGIEKNKQKESTRNPQNLVRKIYLSIGWLLQSWANRDLRLTSILRVYYRNIKKTNWRCNYISIESSG